MNRVLDTALRTAVLVGLPLLAAPAQAQLVRQMTPTAVREALKEGAPFGNYLLSPGGDPYVWVTTPYQRVASLGASARKKYKEVAPAEVPRTLLAATFDVSVDAWLGGDSISYPVFEVEHIVVTTWDPVRDNMVVHQPLRTKVEPKTWTTMMGVQKSGEGMVATFPLKLLADGTQVRVVVKNSAVQVFPVSQPFLDKIK